MAIRFVKLFANPDLREVPPGLTVERNPTHSKKRRSEMSNQKPHPHSARTKPAVEAMFRSLPTIETAAAKLVRGPSRLELTSMITGAATRYVTRFGKDTKVGGAPGPLMTCEASGMSFGFMTPRTMAPGASSSYSMDIWFEHKKVFFSCWNSELLKDYELVTLKRGPWLPALMMLDTCSDVLEAQLSK